METNSICDFCNIDVHRASPAKKFRSTKHIENEIDINKIVPSKSLNEPLGANKPKAKK